MNKEIETSPELVVKPQLNIVPHETPKNQQGQAGWISFKDALANKWNSIFSQEVRGNI